MARGRVRLDPEVRQLRHLVSRGNDRMRSHHQPAGRLVGPPHAPGPPHAGAEAAAGTTLVRGVPMTAGNQYQRE